MAFEQKYLKTDAEMELFIEVMSDPGRKGLTIKQIGERFGMPEHAVIYRLKTKAVREAVKERSKLQQLAALPSIYEALTTKAKAGDTKAIQLWLEYFEGWYSKNMGNSTTPQDSEEAKARKDRVMKWLEEQASKPKDAGEALIIPDGDSEKRAESPVLATQTHEPIPNYPPKPVQPELPPDIQ